MLMVKLNQSETNIFNCLIVLVQFPFETVGTVCWSFPSILYWKEGTKCFNDALNIFYLRLYGVEHMVKDHSDSERGNLLLPYRLLFLISSKGSFICIIPQTG